MIKTEFIYMANNHSKRIAKIEEQKIEQEKRENKISVIIMIILIVICIFALFKISDITTERLEKAYGNMSYSECMSAYANYYRNGN